MPRMFLGRAICVAVALLGGALLSASLAAPTGPVKTDTPATAAEKIRKELDQILSMDIDGQSLQLAINQLREQTKINFILDRLAVQQLGIDPDQTEVKMKLKDVKLKTALRTLLTQYNLSYGIVEDSIIISSEDGVATRQMRQRVTIDLEKVEFGKALKQLARETATNLVVDSRVAKEAAGTVTLQLDDVPLDTAVRLMAESVNLRPVRVGNVLFVCSKTIAAELKADPDINPQPVGPRMTPDGVMIAPGAAIGGGLAPVAPPATVTPPSVPPTAPPATPPTLDKP